MSDDSRNFTERRAVAPALFVQIANYGAYLVGIGGALGLMFTAVTWLTGPIHPQSQIDLANLQKDHAAMVSKIEAVAATEASDKALLLAQIESMRQVIATRLDAMWRQSDYAERDAHLGRLDTALEVLRDKTTDGAYQIKDLQAKYQALTTIPARR